MYDIKEATPEQYKQFCKDIRLSGHEDCKGKHLFLIVEGTCMIHALEQGIGTQEIFDQFNRAKRLGKQAQIYQSIHHCNNHD